ncbi:MAG: PIN domain-containing protein [Acidobacteriota bacterium]
MTLVECPQGVRLVFLDTAPVIYFVEKNLLYLPIVTHVFERIDSGALQAVTSPVTLAECLVHPLRLRNEEATRAFSDLIVNGDNTSFQRIDEHVSARAAELRARHNLTLADAFQGATALAAGCDALLTNDPTMKRVSELKVIVLDELDAA